VLPALEIELIQDQPKLSLDDKIDVKEKLSLLKE
jgi:hypothetical protein